MPGFVTRIPPAPIRAAAPQLGRGDYLTRGLNTRTGAVFAAPASPGGYPTAARVAPARSDSLWWDTTTQSTASSI
jgi:hypothetical protein